MLPSVAHGLADQADIGVRIIPQAPFQFGGHWRAELDEIPVEVLATARLETPLMITLQQLTEAQWVGHRHQFDDAVQQAFGFELGQALFQLPRGTHARQFIGVQAGLNVSLALAATEAEHRNLAFAAQVTPRQ